MRLITSTLAAFSMLTASYAFADEAASTPPRAMTLLTPGQHHSIEPGFNIDNSRALQRSITGYLDDATAAGMRVKPLEISWAEVEPRKGRYELDDVIDRLEDYAVSGWQPLIFVRAIDSDDVTVPAYLKGTDETISLSDIDVSAPEFIDRYNRLMDRIVPLVRAHGGFAILVANEPDNFLGINPELTDQVVTFVSAARAHIHTLDDQIAVGVALSNGFDHDNDLDALRPSPPHYQALIDASDIAVYNLYCLRVPSDAQAASITARIQARIEAAKGREVVIQELGCPSGAGAGFSEELQRSFFEAAFAAMEETPVRVTVVFQLVDWSQATIEFYADALRPLLAAEPAFRDNPDLIFVYLDQLASIGLIDAKDGSAKPAWSTYLQAVERTDAVR